VILDTYFKLLIVLNKLDCYLALQFYLHIAKVILT
jgi:hypothetical protein